MTCQPTHQYHRRRLRLAFALSLVLVISGSALAQRSAGNSTGSTEVTLFAGISTSATKKNETPFGLQVKSSAPFGGRIAYHFTEHHAVEFTVANPVSFHANYVYSFAPRRSKFVPYLTAGAGGSRDSIELRGATGVPGANLNEEVPDRRATAFTANFGGGVKYYLSDRLALRFDARDVVGRYRATFANIAGAPGGVVKGQQTFNDLQFTGGIAFSFGGR